MKKNFIFSIAMGFLLTIALYSLVGCAVKQPIADENTYYLTHQITRDSLDVPILILGEAEFNETVTFYINSPGGYIYEMGMLLEAMRTTEAYIVCIIPPRSQAASAAAIIFMYCDKQIMGYQSRLMFHMASLPNGDPASAAVDEYIVRVFNIVGVHDLLNDVEWKLMVEHRQDIWLSDSQFNCRWYKLCG